MVELIIFLGIGWFIISAMRGKKKDIATPYKPTQNINITTDNHSEKGISLTITNVSSSDHYFTPSAKPISKKDAKWVPLGESVTVDNYIIVDGGLYIGTSLSADINPIAVNKNAAYLGVQSSYSGNWMAQCTQEPSLINPNLSIASSYPDTEGRKMGYWPSYSEIDPVCRLAYLEWLAGGKKDPAVSMGYVFLYFYGIERRIIADTPPDDEIIILIEEVERLRSIYANNSSFNGYSIPLLEAAQFIMMFRKEVAVDKIAPQLDEKFSDQRMVQVAALASHIKENEPLDFEWAMIAYFNVACLYNQRIAARRVRSVFLDLMRKRFAKKWPDGFKVNCPKNKFYYYFNGASQYVRIDLAAKFQLDSLPDPQACNWRKLIEMADKVEDELSAYARAAGRNPELVSSPKSFALLPSEIASEQLEKYSRPLKSWLSTQEGPVYNIKTIDLTRYILGEVPKAIDTRTLRTMAEILAHMGYGLEPDPEFGAIRPKIDDICILFDAKDFKHPRSKVGDTYPLAMSIAMLVAGVAGVSKGGFGEEVGHWVGWIKKTLKLGSYETSRLRAYFELLKFQKLTMTQVKRALAVVPENQRNIIANLAASVAAVDGVIEKSEVEFLEKVYDELGIERSRLYGTLHDMAAAKAEPAVGPVIMNKSTKILDSGFKIRPLPDIEITKDESQVLNTSRINKIIEETQQISSVLTTIFTDNAETPIEVANAGMENKINEESGIFIGLDSAHSLLVARLATREEWGRSEYEIIAREYSLMPDGALEVINEWAFEQFDEALAEDGDIITINRTLIEEMKKDEAA